MLPKIRACFLLIFPVGIGLKHVLVINASKSDSYHMFKHPAAPAPSATRAIPIMHLKYLYLNLRLKNQQHK